MIEGHLSNSKLLMYRSAGAVLDLIQRGTTTVELVVLRKPQTREAPEYAVQIAMLRTARKLRLFDERWSSSSELRG